MIYHPVINDKLKFLYQNHRACSNIILCQFCAFIVPEAFLYGHRNRKAVAK